MKTSKTLPVQALFLKFMQPSYTLVCTIFFTFFFIPEWWIVPIVTILTVFTVRYISYKRVTYFFDQDIIYYKETTIQFEHIKEMTITQTFFQEKLGIATIYILYETGRLSLQHIPLIHAKEMQEIFEKSYWAQY